jgi:hypothetical protein
VRLPSGRIFTGRLDAAVSPTSEPGHVRILESKTTGWRADATIASVKFGGQAAGTFSRPPRPSPRRLPRPRPDVAFWKKDSLNPADISCVRESAQISRARPPRLRPGPRRDPRRDRRTGSRLGRPGSPAPPSSLAPRAGDLLRLQPAV